jgi:hypothetical protein
MDTPKWTPGPWTAVNDSLVRGPHGEAVAATAWTGQYPIDPNRAANAQVIAAAPEMAEALRLALERLEHPVVHDAFRADSVQYDRLDATIVIARAALRKAGVL